MKNTKHQNQIFVSLVLALLLFVEAVLVQGFANTLYASSLKPKGRKIERISVTPRTGYKVGDREFLAMPRYGRTDDKPAPSNPFAIGIGFQLFVPDTSQFDDDSIYSDITDLEALDRHLKSLDADQSKKSELFELFVASRLKAMGLAVLRIGQNSRTPDGGIDFIAWPKNAPFFPLAVQVKYNENKNTPVGVIREFYGAMNLWKIDEHKCIFAFGYVVTNTHFSSVAKEGAKNSEGFVRLRGIDDLFRWIQNDFEKERHDIPNEFKLPDGSYIKIKEHWDLNDILDKFPNLDEIIKCWLRYLQNQQKRWKNP